MLRGVKVDPGNLADVPWVVFAGVPDQGRLSSADRAAIPYRLGVRLGEFDHVVTRVVLSSSTPRWDS